MSMLPPDPIYIFKGEMQPIMCITFKITPFIEHLFAGTQVGVVHVWNLKNKRELTTFKVGDEPCLSINIHEDVAIVQDKSGSISFWKEDKTCWNFLKRIQTDFFGFCKSITFQDSTYSYLKGGKCQIISNKTLEPVKIIDLSDNAKLGDIMGMRIFELNCQKLVLVAYEGNALILWSEEDVKKISKLELQNCPMAIDFHPGSNKGICGDPSNKLLVFSFDKSLEFKLEKHVQLVNPGVATVQIRPDGKLVAVGCWDGKLRLYSWKSLVLLAILDTHSSTVQDVCFSQEWSDSGKVKYLLAAGSKDCRVSLWDLYN